ncbi:MAG TPA: T9SS type A sorting domain-containing protein [Ignavibacteria bacterium]|nr:T9SS type A sorting domain-containing protein [Ignavibacteria bacterium]
MKTLCIKKLFLLIIFILFFSSESFSQLNGTYTIGTGGDYTTITSSVNDLVTSGINGPVVFNILPGVYTELVTIDSVPGSSPVNTITFQSQTGNRDDVLWKDSIFYSAALIVLNKADYITFRNISFLNGVSLSIQYVFYLCLNCDGINISNSSIISRGTFEGYGIYGNNASTKNLFVNENDFDAVIAVNLAGSQRSTGTQILKNRISRYGGILLSNHDSVKIEKNEIILDYRLGFYSSGPAINLNGCNKYFKITKNKINVNGNGLYFPSSGIIIQNCICDNSLIANNFVYYTGGTGLSVSNSKNINIYFNTIHSLYNYYSANAANLNIDRCYDCKVINNIFGGRNTVIKNNFNTAIASDFNLFYPKDEEVLPDMFYFNDTGYDSLDQFRAASENDFHSSVNKILFTSDTDLHLYGASIGDTNLIGIPISGITDDIDGNPRNPLFPYRGADEADTPLPVELNSFSFTLDGNNVMLHWSTLWEINNSGFDIERSDKSNSWNNIGFTAGNGSAYSPSVYFFKDGNLSAGIFNYRLKQIDYNGNFQYYYLSSEVEIGIPGNFSLSQNFPNPFNPNTVISYHLPSGSFVLLKVYDLSGKEIATLVSEKQDAGYYSAEFSGAAFSSGVYFYRLQGDNFSETRKMSLIK